MCFLQSHYEVHKADQTDAAHQILSHRNVVIFLVLVLLPLLVINFRYRRDFMQVSYCLVTIGKLTGFIIYLIQFLVCHLFKVLVKSIFARPLPTVTKIVNHFFDLLIDGKDLISDAQVLGFCLFIHSTQTLFHQHFSCMVLLQFFSRNLLLMKSSRFILSSLHLFLALLRFSSAKLCLLHSFSP